MTQSDFFQYLLRQTLAFTAADTTIECSKDNLLRKTNLDSTDVISDLQAQYIIYADDKSVTFSTEDGTVTVKDKKLYKTEIFADLADGENLYTFDGKDLIIYDLQGNIIDKQSVDMV